MVKPKKTGEISADKLKLIEIVLFDFDGVFTDGIKGASFNERDSMGCNMLRYGLWRINEQKMPLYAIATGQSNENAIKFAQREHFNHIFLDVTNKGLILEFITKKLGIAAESIVMIGDDINDTPLLKATGLRFVVNQPGSKHFYEWLREKRMVDYLTGNAGGHGAVREICEECLFTLGILDEVITSRMNFDLIYQHYWKKRNERKTKFLKQEGDQLIEISL